MDIKKFLREQAEKEAESLLTEEDKLFIQKLFRETEEDNENEEKDDE